MSHGVTLLFLVIPGIFLGSILWLCSLPLGVFVPRTALAFACSGLVPPKFQSYLTATALGISGSGCCRSLYPLGFPLKIPGPLLFLFLLVAYLYY